MTSLNSRVTLPSAFGTEPDFSAYLWGFSGAYHAPKGVVELPGFGQLAVPANGGVDAAEVGQGRGKGEAVQHLNGRDKSAAFSAFTHSAQGLNLEPV